MELVLIRGKSSRPATPGETFTPGVLYMSGIKFCVTCEDEDRFLEDGRAVKIKGKTAIPRGKYQVELYKSPKHGLVPILRGVPRFDFIEMHGGNKAEDSLGCILCGQVCTSTGIAKCADTVRILTMRVQDSINKKVPVFLEIK